MFPVSWGNLSRRQKKGGIKGCHDTTSALTKSGGIVRPMDIKMCD